MPDNERTSELTTTMRRRSRRFIFFVFLVGLYVGAAFDSAFRPNDITFDVDHYEVNLVPMIGDRVHWIKPGGTSKVPVQFGTPPPCTGSPSTRYTDCTVNANVYSFYGCADANYPCADPGFDPTTETRSYLMDLLEPVFDIAYAVHRTANLFGPSHVPFIDTALHTAKGPPVQLGISCESSGTPYPPDTPTVRWNRPPLTPDPLPVKAGQGLWWRAGSMTFQLDFPANTCEEQSHGPIGTNNPFCTLVSTPASDISYPITVSGTGACSNKTGAGRLTAAPASNLTK